MCFTNASNYGTDNIIDIFEDEFSIGSEIFLLQIRNKAWEEYRDNKVKNNRFHDIH